MIQPELLTRLRLLAESYRLPIAAAADKPREVTPVSAVQQVVAEVEARLADGRFRVLAAGQRFDVDLPVTTKPGDRVAIDLATATPVPTSAAGAEGESAPAVLSSAGRLMAQLAPRAPAERVPAQISAPAPLLPDAPVNVPVAAATLRELIALSGLFYESHQAAWVNGERPTAQLLQEPQGRLPPLPAQREATAPAPGPATPGANAPAAETPGRSLPIAPAGQAVSLEREGAPGTPAVRAEAAPLIQQQINTLETRHIVWNGHVWPGQPMRWEIEDSPGRAESPDESERFWQTRMDLELPRLGKVGAILTLNASGLGVRVSAVDPGTGELFGRRLDELRAALEAAGIPVSALARQPHAAPDTRPSAVALAYSEDAGAPRVVARGRGLIAEAIIERARQHGIYVHESRELVALLMQVDLDQQIPPQLYLAVAEVLAWVYRLERGETQAPSPRT